MNVDVFERLHSHKALMRHRLLLEICKLWRIFSSSIQTYCRPR